jgi:DNA-directed RNA polymerase subunit RPC12/RpoP
MPYYYNCTGCKDQIELQEELLRGNASVKCPKCGTEINYKKRNRNEVLNASKERLGASNAPFHKKQRRLAPLPGRAPAAPVRTAWPGTSLAREVAHCPDLEDAAWKNAGNDKVCLAYSCLDPTRPGMEGLIIHCPKMRDVKGVKEHFQAVKEQLEEPENNPQVCEATGEAAAALRIVKGNSLSGGG